MKKELESRLIKFARSINSLCEQLDNSFISKHLTRQIIRSSTSSALNYGEAQSAESKKDFLHKISIVLKELRETNISILILEDKFNDNDGKARILEECNQLIAIFHKTIITTKKNMK